LRVNTIIPKDYKFIIFTFGQKDNSKFWEVNMGEESTEWQLKQHDEAIREVKVDIKDINKNIIKIEKTDIRIEIDVKSILDTYKIIRNTTIGFVVLNILTMLWTLNQK